MEEVFHVTTPVRDACVSAFFQKATVGRYLRTYLTVQELHPVYLYEEVCKQVSTTTCITSMLFPGWEITKPEVCRRAYNMHEIHASPSTKGLVQSIWRIQAVESCKSKS